MNEEAHFDERALEQYVLSQASAADRAALEDHLRICLYCRERLAEIEAFVSAFRAVTRDWQKQPIDAVHDTDLGPVRLRAHRWHGQWMARVSGLEIEYGKPFEKLYDANIFLLEAFRELFPGHRCSSGCRRAPRRRPI